MAQLNLIAPEHRAPTHERTRTREAEEVYAREWERENSGPNGLLAKLLGQSNLTLSQEQATAAAEVVQWLGTPVGHGFLRRCEMQIQNCRDIWARHNPADEIDLDELDGTVAVMLAAEWERVDRETDPKKRRERRIDAIRRVFHMGRTGRW